MNISVDVWPVRDTDKSMEQCALADAHAIGVYIRNPEAMHVRDFEIWASHHEMVKMEALEWAAALAAHLECDFHPHVD